MNFILMTKGPIIFLSIGFIFFSIVFLWFGFMLKKYLEKETPFDGELLEINKSLLGQTFHPVRLFMFTKDLCSNRQLSDTMYIAEVVIKLPDKIYITESIGCDIEEYVNVFYRIDGETYKLFSESDCKEFRLTSKVIKPGEDKLYFEAYSGMR